MVILVFQYRPPAPSIQKSYADPALVADTQGLAHATEVSTANVNDRAVAVMTLLLHADALPEVVCILVDGRYTGELFSHRVIDLLGTYPSYSTRSRHFNWWVKHRTLQRMLEELA